MALPLRVSKTSPSPRRLGVEKAWSLDSFHQNHQICQILSPATCLMLSLPLSLPLISSLIYRHGANLFIHQALAPALHFGLGHREGLLQAVGAAEHAALRSAPSAGPVRRRRNRCCDRSVRFWGGMGVRRAPPLVIALVIVLVVLYYIY